MSVGLLALLDDVTSILDDVAAMTKKAASKTAGVVADDLAVNAHQLNGSAAERELPIVGKVALGSLINKFILIPLILTVSYFYPPLLTVMLIIGGLYLSYEGAEKVLHYFGLVHDESDEHEEGKKLSENQKIMGAIRTDFVLSTEILVIAMSELQGQTITDQAIVLTIVGILMTIGVYGFVAMIVRADDVGFWMVKKPQQYLKKIGKWIINVVPGFMRGLTVVGTIAMFMVGGSILNHNIHFLHDISQHIVSYWATPYSPAWVIEQLCFIITGLILGSAVTGALKIKDLF